MLTAPAIAGLYLLGVGLLTLLIYKVENLGRRYRYQILIGAGIEDALMFSVFWPLTSLLIVPFYAWHAPGLIRHIKSKKAYAKERATIESKIEDRMKSIEAINADIDRFEETRREDVLSGREIIDIREGLDRENCYVCNKVRSPYSFGGNGKMINTISGVPAHEDCLMGKLSFERY